MSMIGLAGQDELSSAKVDVAPVTTADGRLVRKLGAFDLTLIGIGASIGSGIFVLSGKLKNVKV